MENVFGINFKHPYLSTKFCQFLRNLFANPFRHLLLVFERKEVPAAGKLDTIAVW